MGLNTRAETAKRLVGELAALEEAAEARARAAERRAVVLERERDEAMAMEQTAKDDAAGAREAGRLYRAERDRAIQAAEEAKAQVRSLKERCEAAERDRETITKRLDAVAEIAWPGQNLKASERHPDCLLAALDNRIASAASGMFFELKQVRADLAAERTRRETAEGLVAERNAEIERLKGEAASLRAQLDGTDKAAQARVDAAKAERDSAQSRETLALATVQTLRAQLVDVERRFGLAREDVDRLVESSRGVRGVLASVEAERDALRALVESLRSGASHAPAPTPERPPLNTWDLRLEGATIAAGRQHRETSALIESMSTMQARLGRWKCLKCDAEVDVWGAATAAIAPAGETGQWVWTETKPDPMWMHRCGGQAEHWAADRLCDAPTEPRVGRWRCARCRTEREFGAEDATRRQATADFPWEWSAGGSGKWMHWCAALQWGGGAHWCERIGDAPNLKGT